MERSCMEGRNSEPNPRVVLGCAAKNFPMSRSCCRSRFVLCWIAASESAKWTGGWPGAAGSDCATASIAFMSHSGGMKLSLGAWMLFGRKRLIDDGRYVPMSFWSKASAFSTRSVFRRTAIFCCGVSSVWGLRSSSSDSGASSSTFHRPRSPGGALCVGRTFPSASLPKLALSRFEEAGRFCCLGFFLSSWCCLGSSKVRRWTAVPVSSRAFGCSLLRSGLSRRALSWRDDGGRGPGRVRLRSAWRHP